MQIEIVNVFLAVCFVMASHNQLEVHSAVLKPHLLKRIAYENLEQFLEIRKNVESRTIPNLVKPPAEEIVIIEEPDKSIRSSEVRNKVESRATPNLVKPPVEEIVIIEEPDKAIRISQKRLDDGSDEQSSYKRDSYPDNVVDSRSIIDSQQEDQEGPIEDVISSIDDWDTDLDNGNVNWNDINELIKGNEESDSDSDGDSSSRDNEDLGENGDDDKGSGMGKVSEAIISSENSESGSGDESESRSDDESKPGSDDNSESGSGDESKSGSDDDSESGSGEESSEQKSEESNSEIDDDSGSGSEKESEEISLASGDDSNAISPEDSGSGSDKGPSSYSDESGSGTDEETGSGRNTNSGKGNLDIDDLIFYFEEGIGLHDEKGSGIVNEEEISPIHHRPTGGDDTIPNIIFDTEDTEHIDGGKVEVEGEEEEEHTVIHHRPNGDDDDTVPYNSMFDIDEDSINEQGDEDDRKEEEEEDSKEGEEEEHTIIHHRPNGDDDDTIPNLFDNDEDSVKAEKEEEKADNDNEHEANQKGEEEEENTVMHHGPKDNDENEIISHSFDNSEWGHNEDNTIVRDDDNSFIDDKMIRYARRHRIG